MDNTVEHNNGFPDPRCQLHFQRTLQDIAQSSKDISASQHELTKTIRELKKVIHGENYDNGLNHQVRKNMTAIEEARADMTAFTKALGVIDDKMLRWGFFLLGGQTVISGIFTTALFFILKTLIEK